MIAYSAFLLLASTFAVSFLPERLDLKGINLRGSHAKKVVSIPYKSFFKNTRVVMALVAVAICATCHFYLNSDINLRIVANDGSASSIILV